MKLSAIAAVTGMLVTCSSGSLVADTIESTGGWQETEWNGERAFVAVEGDWRAIVSIERARLVYFGRAGSDTNVLFAPTTRDHPAGWGGHRVWLGPQAEWPGGWPPPKAWEESAAQAASVNGSVLELTLFPSGSGWPDLAREYFWSEGALHCRVRFRGGRHPAQFIQIVQVLPTASVTVRAAPSATAPQGYVQLHLGRSPSPQPNFAAPSHVTELVGNERRLSFLDRTEKLGFQPQSLRARIDQVMLEVGRGEASGRVLSTPDDGFVTQVYLGSGENQLIELEQLSPLYQAGETAAFEIVLRANPATE